MAPSTNQETRTRQLLMLPVPRAIEIRIEDRFLPSLGVTRPTMGYHVSIVGPFFWQHDARESALARVRQACAMIKPLRLALQELDVFENGPDDCAVFIKVGPVQRLRRLHQHLIRALGGAAIMQYQRSKPFRPHITLGLNLPSRACQSLSQTSALWSAHFRASELWLLEQQPQNPWRPLLSFSLGLDEAPCPLDVELNDG